MHALGLNVMLLYETLFASPDILHILDVPYDGATTAKPSSEHARTNEVLKEPRRKLLTTCLPCPNHVSRMHQEKEQPQEIPLLQVEQVDVVIKRIETLCTADEATTTQHSPWLTHTFVGTVTQAMKALSWVGDTWDKRLHRAHMCCEILCQQYTVTNVIYGKIFTIRGWADTAAQARQWVLLFIMLLILSILHDNTRCFSGQPHTVQ